MKKSILIIISSLFLLNSCELLGPLDNIQPENVLVDNTLISDASSAEQALNGIYATWKGYSITAVRDCMSGMAGILLRSSTYGGADFLKNAVKPDNYLLDSFYAQLYKVINTSNSLIVNLDAKEEIKGLTAERRKDIIAQATFSRALAHFMLLRHFGEFWDLNSEYGVVVWREPVRDNIAKARSKVSECYESILSDLDFAITNGNSSSLIPYYSSPLAAKGLKAKVLLSKGDYAGAAKFAKETINEGLAQGNILEPELLGVYHNSFESNEILFTLHCQYPNSTIPGYYYDFMAGAGITVNLIADELVGEATDGDIDNETGYDDRFIKIYSSTYMVSPWGFNKYQSTDRVEGKPGNTYYFLRMGEMYAILAEASARQSKFADARDAMRPLCKRAKYADDYIDNIANKDLLMTILKHKYMELFGENNEEWFDMVRYKQINNIDFKALRWVNNMDFLNLPMPKSALAGNKLLTQNKKY